MKKKRKKKLDLPLIPKISTGKIIGVSTVAKIKEKCQSVRKKNQNYFFLLEKYKQTLLEQED